MAPEDNSESQTRLTESASASAHVLMLAPGHKLGGRYTIVKLIGRGGMGAVYQAFDEELRVATAIKAVLADPDADEATLRDLEQRFKREILLARQVTHKNVVRIHDLFEADGVKYITMPLVEGETLAAILRRSGRLPVDQALKIARQVADGLAAAHEAGIVHRDLKPENIMVTPDGQALVMDFGIARDGAGATQTAAGKVVGTIEYMAPEHAAGQAVDQRADIYAFGLILYDMLTGRRRLAAHEHAMSELFDRMRHAPAPLRSLRPDIPEALDHVITSCVQPDVAARFASTRDLVRALDRLTSEGAAVADVQHAAGSRQGTWLLAAVAISLIAVVSSALWVWRSANQSPPAAATARPPMSVLISNFTNDTGDPLFDGLIEQALGVGLESASFINAYSRRDALRRAQDLQGGVLDVNNAQLIAIREGINVVIAGSIGNDAGGYRLGVRAIEPGTTPRDLLNWDTAAKNKDDVLPAIGRMAARVRNELGDQTVSAERFRVEETFTAASLEAAHAYVQGQELHYAGKPGAAIESYKTAVKLDPDLGRAWAGMAVNAANLQRRDEAANYYREALARIDRMTEREKYRTRITYYGFSGNAEKALEESEALLQQFPADGAGLTGLAIAYLQRREFDKAIERGKQSAALAPKNSLRQVNVALFQMYAGQFAEAEKQAQFVLSLNERYEKARLTVGISQLAQNRVAEAANTYRSLLSLSPVGRVQGTYGLADLQLLTGNLQEAETTLQPVVSVESSQFARARLLLTQAEVRLAQQRARDAARLAEQALAISTDSVHLYLAGRVLIAANEIASVEALAGRLESTIGNTEAQAQALLLRAEIALQQANARAALTHAQAAQKLADSWLARYLLGRAYLDGGLFAEADREFDFCLTRRPGEVAAVFFDDIPTWRFVAPVHYYQGLARTGLNSTSGAAESFKTFLAFKEGGDETGGLVADARKRIQ